MSRLPAAIAALLLLGVSTAGAERYETRITICNDAVAPPQDEDEQTTPPAHISGTLSHPAGIYSYDCTAEKGATIVQGWMESGYSTLNKCRVFVADTNVEDFVITDGTGVAKPVSFYVNLDVTGFSYLTRYEPLDKSRGCVESRVRVWFNVSSSNDLESILRPEEDGYSCFGSSTGIFTGHVESHVDTTVAIGPFSLNTEQVVTFSIRSRIQLAPNVAAGGTSVELTGAWAVSYPTHVPLISLPAGFNANSAEGCIVDNWYTGPGFSAVPEITPTPIRLAQNRPNPFTDATRIAFGLPRTGDVRLEIFDVQGRRVRSLVNGHLAAGLHDLTWDGRNSGRAPVPGGIYFYRLDQGGQTIVRRMIVAR